MERKRVAGRFVREGLDGDGGAKAGVKRGSGAAPKPKQCRTFTRKKVAEALPDIVETFVEEAKKGSITQTAGVQYHGTVGPGLIGWTIANFEPASDYLGNGGTHVPPHIAYSAAGVWQRTMDLEAGEENVFSVHCNSHGCGRWDSNYNLFELDSSVGVDTVSFQPGTSTLQMGLRGAVYGFSPQAFTAGTINAGTVNATTLNGAVNAGQLPLFRASGSGHGPGAVPDPGATAGSTRYLREDGTWATPAGGGSGGLGVGAGSSSGAAIAGATADYNFMQGTGTVVTDNSGNSNNGALGTGALSPSWTPTGLAFSGQQQVVLPAALNTAKTFFFGVYLNPLTNTSALAAGNQLPALLTSSLGVSGLNLLYVGLENGGPEGNAAIFAPTIFANNGFPTAAPNLISGFHVLAFALGAGSGSLDHIYLDGVEIASYSAQESSFGSQTSGNLFLGSSDIATFTASGLNGTMYRFVAMPGNTLSAAQVQAISGQIRAEIASRGVEVAPRSVVQGQPALYGIGDSITQGAGLSSPGTQTWFANLNLTNQPAYVMVNDGIVGITVRAVVGSEANRVGQLCTTTSGPSVAIVFLGTNDLATQHPASHDLLLSEPLGGLAGEIQTLKTAGCRVFVGTMISRGETDAFGSALDTDKDAYDSSILSRAKVLGADGVVDFAASPLLGADGANANTTVFQSDQTNPTAAGQLLLAAAASNTLNYYFGSNAASPAVVSAAMHMILSGEGYISVAPTANQALTLPDCTGPSGATYTVSNPQSAFSVSVVAGSASQLINGLGFGTAVAVPANGSVVFRDVPNPKNVSGCHWEM